jgi:DNA modification methylase
MLKKTVEKDFFRPENAPEPDEWSGRSRDGHEWQILQADAQKALSKMDKETFHCAVTSPPYYSLRDYGVEGQLGVEDNVEEYVEAIALVMDEVKRVLRKDGLLFLNIGDTYYSGKGKSHGIDRKSNKRRFGLRPVDRSGGLGIGLLRKSLIGIPWRVATEMCSRGWVLRSAIIWHREKCLPEPVADRPSRSYENVFIFAKDRHYYFNKTPLIEKHIEEDMWTIPARPRANNGLDTAPYPDELVRRCLEIGCAPKGKVLDPFLGSGTTARVSLSMGHPTVGIDLKREFCLYSAKQLSAL